jgi:spore maturation protein CgeB
MPEGFDQTTFRPMKVAQDIPVSFIGGAYGFRPEVVDFLRRRGIPVQAFGSGWDTRSVWGAEQVEIINRSVINLGMGGIGYSEDLTNVKTRDFEIPGTGGGLYLTSFNADLASHFFVGEEIACYRNRDEMLESVRYFLRHTDEARLIARRARERCLAEHRWLHRYRRICQILGVLGDERHGVAGQPDGWRERRREVSAAERDL